MSAPRSTPVGSPSAAVLHWVGGVLGVTGVRAVAIAPRGPWRMETEGAAAGAVLVQIAAGEHERIDTLTTVLTMAARHALPAPQLLAVDAGTVVPDVVLILETELSGTSRIPQEATDARLQQIGAAMTAIHAIDLAVDIDLPTRTRSLSGVDFVGHRGDDEVGGLLRRADAVVAAAPPVGRRSLVHGDLWQGQMLWVDEHVTGIVDWDFAGVGDPGIDLGSVRMDVAIMFGQAAADTVLSCWHPGFAVTPAAVAYWDLNALAGSPGDLALWLPNFHAQGRTDLDLTTVTARRDHFLRRALAAL